MKVTVVNESPLFPMTGGARLRTMNLLLRLGGRHDITVIFRAGPNPDENIQTVRFLQRKNLRPIIADDPPDRSRGTAFYARLAANLLSSRPYNSISHNSSAVRSAIRQHALTDPGNLWQFEWLSYIDALPPNCPAARVIDAHDVVSTLWQRHLESERHPARRWYIRRQWRRVLRFEEVALRSADRVVAVSDADADTFRNRYHVSHLDVVENGVDRQAYESLARRRENDSILFLGVLDSLPNLDAIRQLLDLILPAVRAKRPAAKLTIVGRNPPVWLRQRLASTPQVEIHADVADVRPYLARASLLAVPLRIGSGSRLKILEALAAGVPVVSTALGAEGLTLENGKDLVLVPRIQEMADAIVRCLRDPARYEAMAAVGRSRVFAQYDWDILARKLESIWERCVHDTAACADHSRRGAHRITCQEVP